MSHELWQPLHILYAGRFYNKVGTGTAQSANQLCEVILLLFIPFAALHWPKK